jgi:hypothetical protein
MTIPGYESKETYTAEEVSHLVAREVAKQQLSDLKARLESQEQWMKDAVLTIESKLKEIIIMIQKSDDELDACKKSIKEEIRAEYATRLELQELRADIRVLSTKIITAVSVVTLIIQFAFQYFGK